SRTMNKLNSIDLIDGSLSRPVTSSVPGPALGAPEADAQLNTRAPCLAKSQSRATQALVTRSLSTDDVAAASIQPRQLFPNKAMPVELLQIIMRMVMKNYLSRPISKYYQALTRMRLVCRRWTVILEETPEFWARLSPDMDDRLIDLALSRSMQSPLTITGHRLYSSPAVDKLLQHTYRWKVLDVNWLDEVTSNRLTVHSAPLLEELRLRFSLFGSRIPFNGSAPMLRIVHIRDYGVQWSTSLFSNLHELGLSCIQERGPDFDTLLHILSNSPRRTRLQVRQTWITPTSSPQTRVPLSQLRDLELEFLKQDVLEHLVEAIDIPPSTNCLFSVIHFQDPWNPAANIQPLEPIAQRLKTLANASTGIKSTLTFRQKDEDVTMIYEADADQYGTLTTRVVVGNSRFIVPVVEHFARQLAQSEPNPVPPALHIIYPSNETDNNGYEADVLQKLSEQLPTTQEILIEDPSGWLLDPVFGALFPRKRSSRLFPHLSTLKIRSVDHGDWARWLQKRQERRVKQGGVDRQSSFDPRIYAAVTVTFVIVTSTPPRSRYKLDHQTTGRILPHKSSPYSQIMDKPSAAELTESSLDRPATSSLPEPPVCATESKGRLDAGGSCLAKSQGGIMQPSISCSVSTNDVAAAGTQPQQLAPIETMPLELFRVIMTEAMKKYRFCPAFRYYHALTRMRLVCKRWTVILERTPELWAILSPNMGEILVDLALSRSMQSPLTITGHALSSSPVVDKLLQHIHRWKVLDVNYLDEATNNHLSVHSAPILEELKLGLSLFGPPILLFNGLAPMLRIVHIRHYGVQWSTSVFSNLYELDLRKIQQGGPDVDTFLHILSNSPRLTHLRVQDTHLTRSSTYQTRVTLSHLHHLELGFLQQDILEQLIDAIDIPMSTNCLFSVALAYHPVNFPNYQKLDPIVQRLKALANASIQAKSTLTFGKQLNGTNRGVTMTYEGEGDQHGALAAQVVMDSRFTLHIVEYFAHQLGQSEPNPVPPALHLVYPPNETYAHGDESEILQTLSDQLPGTEEILIEDRSAWFLDLAFDTLFPPKHLSRPFPRVSTLIIRSGAHAEWAYWLQRRQERRVKGGDVYRLPLQTLKIQGGNIRTGKVKALKRLVPNLVLDGVKIR
ncbi:hypothetical protein FRC01_002028, partial [Tulasnella sp. 417]